MWYLTALLFLFTVGCLSCLSEESIDSENCGKVIESGRIREGHAVIAAQFPWMVTIQQEIAYEFKHICGGTIINSNWILTAASCFKYKEKPSKYEIFLGMNRLSNKVGRHVKRHKISKIVVYKYFDNKTRENDIAMLRVKHPIDIEGSKGFVDRICLPINNRDPTITESATAIGWGIKDSVYISNRLQKVNLRIFDKKLCNQVYAENWIYFRKDIVCAGDNTHQACLGDNGGPLIQYNTKGRAVLLGITSLGLTCGEKIFPLPGVFTKVAAYTQWITNVTLEN